MATAFIVHGKVVIIHGSLLSEFPNVTNKVRAMHGVGCGAVLEQLCIRDCSLVVYVDISSVNRAVKKEYGDEITRQNLNWPYFEHIKGFFTLALLPTHSEIFNVCSDPCARGKGIAKQLFKAMIETVPDQWSIWLGVKLDNPFWDAAIHVYAQTGFGNPVIAHTSPSGFAPGFPFLSLFFRRGWNTLNPSAERIKAVEEVSSSLRDMYLASQGMCGMRVHASPGLMTRIKNNLILSQSVEFGGAMAVLSETNKLFELGIPNGSVVPGSSETFVVSPPSYFLNWHTHPLICYTEHKCYIGWPSGQDMGLVTRQYINGAIGHLVFTGEGVYIIQLTPGMMKFMSIISKEPNCINAVVEVISGRFGDLEQFRSALTDPAKYECLIKQDVSCLMSDSENKERVIEMYLTLASTATFKDMFEWSRIISGVPNIAGGAEFALISHAAECLERAGADVNFPIFSVGFEKWNVVEAEGLYATLLFLQAPNNPVCPIPIYSDSFGWGSAIFV